MSEKQDIFQSLKEDTKELNKMRKTIDRFKEDLYRQRFRNIK